MKLKELAEKYGVDITELSCAVSVAAGKELTAEDEVEITPEVVASVKDFLGIDLSQELGGSEESSQSSIEEEIKEEKVPSEEAGEEKTVEGEVEDSAIEGRDDTEDKEMTVGEPKESGDREQEEKREKVEEAGEEEKRAEELGEKRSPEEEKKEGPEVREDTEEVSEESKKEAEVEGRKEEEKEEGAESEEELKDKGEEVVEGPSEEAGKQGEETQKEAEGGEREALASEGVEIEGSQEISEEEIGGTAETGQEKGSPHQEAVQEGSRGDAEEAVQSEEEEAGEETPGGDKSVPEGVGDERSILLGDSAPPSSQSTAEEKISLDEVKIKEEVVDPNQDVPVPSQEVALENVPPEPVPVETVESPPGSEEKERVETGYPKVFIYILLGLSFLSFVLILIGIIKLFSHSEKKESAKPSLLASTAYSDADVFAIMFRMIEKGNYATAEDLFEEMKVRFPDSKFLDDAGIYLGDVFFDKRVDLPPKERYQKAFEYYQFAYQISPRRLNKEKALLRMAHSCYRMEDYERAIEYYKRFLAEFPFSEFLDEARYYLGMAYLKKGDDGLAEKEFKSLMGVDKGSPYRALGLYQLVRYYFSRGQWNEVVQVAPVFMQDYSRHEKLSEVLFMYADALIALGRIDEAITAYESAEKHLMPDLLPRLYLRKGEAYEKKGDIDSAIKTYLEMAKKFKYDDLSAEAMYRAGLLLEREGNLSKAERVLYDLKERFYRWERLPDALFLLSQILARQGRFRDAERWLREIVKKFPDYPEKERVYWYIARMLELQGKYKDAVRVYDKLLRMIPKEEKAIRLKIYLAKADALMRSKQYSKAIGVFASVLTEFKKYSGLDRGKILYRLSIAYFYNGDYAKAIESFKDAIKNSPLSPWRFKCRYMLGRTYEAVGQIQEAIDQYSRIANNRFLGDRKLKSLSWEALGRIYLRLERYEDAFYAFKNARALATDWWRLTELLRLQADALLGKKDFGSALKLYAKYLTRLLSAYDAKLKEEDGKFSLTIGRDSPEAFERIVGALIKIGDTNYRMGNYQKALRVYKKVKALYEERELKVPDWVLYQIGMCYKMLDDWTKAVAFFDKVIEEYPESIWAREANWQKNEMQIMEKLNQAKEVLETVEK